MMFFLIDRLSSRSLPYILIGFAWAAFMASGCAPLSYRPINLPNEFAAKPAVPLDTINLASFSDRSNSQEVICWGDLLSIAIDSGMPSQTPRLSEIRVARDGTVKVPLVGPVLVAGMEIERAEAAIAGVSSERGIYTRPFVSVRISEPRKDRITVVGAVEKPGVYELPRGSCSLMAALVSAEGLKKSANGDVEIRHTDFRLASVETSGGSNGVQLASYQRSSNANDGVVRIHLPDAANQDVANHSLQDGDVINVLSNELPPIHVLGLVNKPGSFEVTADRDMYLLDAVSLAGGVSIGVADKVTVRRRVSGKAEPITIVASIRKAMDGKENLLLSPGDTVMVRQTPATVIADVFRNFVRLGIGGTASFF